MGWMMPDVKLSERKGYYSQGELLSGLRNRKKALVAGRQEGQR